MPTVRIQDLGVIKFPEGMTPEQIEAVINREILPSWPTIPGEPQELSPIPSPRPEPPRAALLAKPATEREAVYVPLPRPLPELRQGRPPYLATRLYEAVRGEPPISLPPPGVMPGEEWEKEGPTIGQLSLPAALTAATIASAGMAAPAILPAIARLTLSQLGGGLSTALLGSEAARRGLGK